MNQPEFLLVILTVFGTYSLGVSHYRVPLTVRMRDRILKNAEELRHRLSETNGSGAIAFIKIHNQLVELAALAPAISAGVVYPTDTSHLSESDTEDLRRLLSRSPWISEHVLDAYLSVVALYFLARPWDISRIRHIFFIATRRRSSVEFYSRHTSINSSILRISEFVQMDVVDPGPLAPRYSTEAERDLFRNRVRHKSNPTGLLGPIITSLVVFCIFCKPDAYLRWAEMAATASVTFLLISLMSASDVRRLRRRFVDSSSGRAAQLKVFLALVFLGAIRRQRSHWAMQIRTFTQPLQISKFVALAGISWASYCFAEAPNHSFLEASRLMLPFGRRSEETNEYLYVNHGGLRTVQQILTYDRDVILPYPSPHTEVVLRVDGKTEFRTRTLSEGSIKVPAGRVIWPAGKFHIDIDPVNGMDPKTNIECFGEKIVDCRDQDSLVQLFGDARKKVKATGLGIEITPEGIESRPLLSTSGLQDFKITLLLYRPLGSDNKFEVSINGISVELGNIMHGIAVKGHNGILGDLEKFGQDIKGKLTKSREFEFKFQGREVTVYSSEGAPLARANVDRSADEASLSIRSAVGKVAIERIGIMPVDP